MVFHLSSSTPDQTSSVSILTKLFCQVISRIISKIFYWVIECFSNFSIQNIISPLGCFWKYSLAVLASIENIGIFSVCSLQIIACLILLVSIISWSVRCNKQYKTIGDCNGTFLNPSNKIEKIINQKAVDVFVISSQESEFEERISQFLASHGCNVINLIHPLVQESLCWRQNCFHCFKWK